MAKAKEKPLNFEQAIEKVEAIIEKIESGEVNLEKCLEEYESGIKLLNQCQAILNLAEKRISKLSVDAQGQLVEEKKDDE